MPDHEKKSGGCAGCLGRIFLWSVIFTLAFSVGWLVNEREDQGNDIGKAWDAGVRRLGDIYTSMTVPAGPNDAEKTPSGSEPDIPDAPPIPAAPGGVPDQPEADTEPEAHRGPPPEELPTLTTDMAHYATGHAAYSRGLVYYRQAMDHAGSVVRKQQFLQLARHELQQAMNAFIEAEHADPGNEHLLQRIQETQGHLTQVKHMMSVTR